MGDSRAIRFPWFVVCAFTTAVSARAAGGVVNVELRPASQSVNVGDTVEIGLFAVSADGPDQPVGFFGAVITWDAAALALIDHVDTGTFAWSSSSFPSDPAGVNNAFVDGDAYYQATVWPDGPYAMASAAGSLITTLRFTAFSSSTASTSVRVIPCVGATCTRVLNKHPFDAGVTDVTGAIGPAVEVTVLCQTNDQCDDANPCTDDACTGGNVCAHAPNDAGDPSDGLFCNGHEICANGQVIVKAGTIPDCNDGQPCTTDSCNEAADRCDNLVDAGFCLVDGICRTDGAINPLNECEACIAAANPLAWAPRASGVACGSPTNTECDRADACDGAGLCLDSVQPTGTPCGSSLDTLCTAPDTCDGAGQCLSNHASNGTACEDGLFCTAAQSCQGGQCLGSGTACPGQVCDELVDRCKAVGLEFRPPQQGPVPIADIVAIGLYAVSGTGTDQAISAVSAVLVWDPDKLELLGVLNNGPVNWLISAFPNDSGLDGLNNTFLDGDALYKASTTPNPNPPALATSGGLLVTTIQFRAIGTGSAAVRMAASRGGFSKTQVTDAETIGLDITGTIGPPVSITIVECLTAADCDDGDFCNGPESCVDSVCANGAPPNCDDGVFCSGVETCPSGVGCVSPGNPCPDPASCDESTRTCGGCAAPVVATAGSRYLAVTPTAGFDPVALLVTGDAADSDVRCLSLYIQDDGALADTPRYFTPAAWETVFARGLEIRPGTRYAVQADCRLQSVGFLSNKAYAQTWVWGDVNGDGAALVNDVTLVLDGTQGLIQGGATLQSLDLSPCTPDGNIDAEDLASVQAAFSGVPFSCVSPCNACVPSSPPQRPANGVPTNRYLSFAGGNPSLPTAVRVTLASLPPPFDIWNGRVLWVGQPQAVSELPSRGFNDPPGGEAVFWAATLRCQPVYLDWSQFGAVDVYHASIVPSRLALGGGAIAIPSVYGVQEIDARCDLADEGAYSTGLSVTMAAFGDVAGAFANGSYTAPDDRVDVTIDVLAVLLKFSGAATAPVKARADLEPASPDGKINISDVIVVLNGFSGSNYGFPPGAFPCP